MSDSDTRTRGNDLYERDFYAWTQHQAEVLRSLPVTDNRFDREHVAEEIEDLGKSERHSVESQIARVLEHFLKLAYSPADRPRYGWMRSIVEARRQIKRTLTATLRRHAEDEFAELYEDAREAFEEMTRRNRAYRDMELKALMHDCRLGLGA